MKKHIVSIFVLSLVITGLGKSEVLLDNTFVSPYVNMFTMQIGTSNDGTTTRPFYQTYELGVSFSTGNSIFNNIIYQPRFGWSSGNGLENVQFSLFSDLNNAPSSLVGLFSGSTVPSEFSIDNLYYLEPSLALSPQTKYWIVGSNTGAGLVGLNSSADTSINTSNGFEVGDWGGFVNGAWGIVRTADDPNYQPTVFKLSGSAVPEPSSLSLLALGGVVVALRRRRE